MHPVIIKVIYANLIDNSCNISSLGVKKPVRWGNLEAEIASYEAVNMEIKIINIFKHNVKEFFQIFSVFKLPFNERVTQQIARN